MGLPLTDWHSFVTIAQLMPKSKLVALKYFPINAALVFNIPEILMLIILSEAFRENNLKSFRSVF